MNDQASFRSLRGDSITQSREGEISAGIWANPASYDFSGIQIKINTDVFALPFEIKTGHVADPDYIRAFNFKALLQLVDPALVVSKFEIVFLGIFSGI